MNATINIENYLEWFCLYADKELDATQQQAVLRFVDEHPHLRHEFDVLPLTIVPIENEVADFKQELYKKEKLTPIISLTRQSYFYKIASVAALLLMCIGVYYGYQTNNTSNQIQTVQKIHIAPSSPSTNDPLIPTQRAKANILNPVLQEMIAFEQGRTEKPIIHTSFSSSTVENSKADIHETETQYKQHIIRDEVALVNMSIQDTKWTKQDIAPIQLNSKPLPLYTTVIENKNTLTRTTALVNNNKLITALKEDAKDKITRILDSKAATALASNTVTKSILQKTKNTSLYQSVSDDFSGKIDRIRQGAKQLGVIH